MKYAIIIIVIILLVRWETIVKLVDKTEGLVTTDEIKPTEQAASSQIEIIPVTKDKSIEQSPLQKIVSLIEDFYRSPSDNTRDLIITEIRANPGLFGESGQEDYLSIMSKFPSHIEQKTPLVNSFLFELWPLMRGANLLIVKQLLAMNFEIDLVSFLDQLAKSGRDPSCFIAEITPDGLTKEVKEKFLLERKANIEKIINDEAGFPKIKTMGLNCFRIIEIELLKINAPAAELPETTPTNSNP